MRIRQRSWPVAGFRGAGSALVLASALATSGDLAAQMPGPRPVSRPILAICHFAEDTDAVLRLPILDAFALPPAQANGAQKADSKPAADDDDDEEDEDEDEEDGEEEDSDPPLRNFIALRTGPGLQRGPCYKVSGTATFSVTMTDGTSTAGRVLGRQSDRVLKEARGLLGLQMIEDLPVGRFRAGLEFDWSEAAGANAGSLSSLWMSLGPVSLGLRGSYFDFWSGDEFGFKATAPSASTFLTALALRAGERGTLMLSAENPSQRRLSDLGYAGVVLPDVVARWKYEGESTTLHLAGALRQLRFASPDQGTRYGHAILVGMQQQISAIGTGDYLTAQFTYADTAPGYLGIAQPGGLLRFSLPRNAPVFLMETMRGWTAALSYSHGWSEKWRSNAFVTYVDLRVTEGPGRGKVQVGRAAINLVWTPVTGLDLTWELGAARIYQVDTALGLASFPTRASYTGQFTVSRRF
jgi:hypothetical protein